MLLKSDKVRIEFNYLNMLYMYCLFDAQTLCEIMEGFYVKKVDVILGLCNLSLHEDQL